MWKLRLGIGIVPSNQNLTIRLRVDEEIDAKAYDAAIVIEVIQADSE